MFYSVKLVIVIAATVVLSLLTILGGPFDANGKRVYRISQLWTWIIVKFSGIRLTVEGLDRLDPKRQYLFVVNHQSNFDIPVLVQSLPQFQLRWIAKKELLWIPFFGWAMWAAKHITVDRADSLDALKSLKLAKQRIAAGISVVVFPEGTRSTDGKLLPFKRGGFLLALKTKTPIVPVTINGTGKLLARGEWRVQPGAINVTISAPIMAHEFRPGGLRGLSAKVQEIIAANLQTNEPFDRNQESLTRASITAPGSLV
ncbi:MAG TPA: lysophospholipid acyltransferase family protein [Candidatus Limnocylindrales bacterium]|nr:lysophospholipid acyltransferase family protein [Candidatus Limnocylindrales bacterium]